jgi:DNA-binding response OmpR family regulator
MSLHDGRPIQQGHPKMNDRRLLIVEDHEPTRHLLDLFFRRRGWETSAAGTLAEGLSLLDSAPSPNCLLLDLDLPDGRGEVLLQKVRRDRLPVRVTICSGMGDPNRWSTVWRLAPEALFQKPVNLADVCRVCEVDDSPSLHHPA